MKKNYIAPQTEKVLFGTSYLMQDPVISMAAASGDGGGSGSTATTGDSMFID